MSNFIIDSKTKLKEKLDLVESLSDIKVAAEIVDDLDNDKSKTSEADLKYKKLNCGLEVVDPKSKEFKLVEQFMQTTDSTSYGKALELKDLFRVDRKGEDKKFKKKVGNRKLLWHGSSFRNFGGILS